MEGSAAEGARTIKGELFRVEGGNYFVKGTDGKEVRVHTDSTTHMQEGIKKGDRIEAKVNDQNHALSIRPTQLADRRNETGVEADSTLGSGKAVR